MNKGEQREVQKIRALVSAGEMDMAARSMAPLLRAASVRNRDELLGVANELKIRNHLRALNGTYVANGEAC